MNTDNVIRVDEVVMWGDIQTHGAKVMALVLIESAVNEFNENLKVFPDAETFGVSKFYSMGEWEVEVSLVQLPNNVKALAMVSFRGG